MDERIAISLSVDFKKFISLCNANGASLWWTQFPWQCINKCIPNERERLSHHIHRCSHSLDYFLSWSSLLAKWLNEYLCKKIVPPSKCEWRAQNRLLLTSFVKCFSSHTWRIYFFYHVCSRSSALPHYKMDCCWGHDADKKPFFTGAPSDNALNHHHLWL